jgi:hypothetical protein
MKSESVKVDDITIEIFKDYYITSEKFDTSDWYFVRAKKSNQILEITVREKGPDYKKNIISTVQEHMK